MIVHFFFNQPSEVLSGDIRLTSPPPDGCPNRILPTSSEKEFSKKLTSCHETCPSAGQIQYWSDRESPRHFTNNACGELMCSSSSAWRRPDLLAGIARPCHHALSAARSILPFFTGIPTGIWAVSNNSTTAETEAVALSRRILATGISLCIKMYV